jgi:hypothetical protein
MQQRGGGDEIVLAVPAAGGREMNDAQAGVLLHNRFANIRTLPSNTMDSKAGASVRRQRQSEILPLHQRLAIAPTWTECWIVSAMTAQPDATRPNTINGKTDADSP